MSIRQKTNSFIGLYLFLCLAFLPPKVYADDTLDLFSGSPIYSFLLKQMGEFIKQSPDLLEKGLDKAIEFREFGSNKDCLGGLQALILTGSIASNIMPFSNVYTSEDTRGPFGKFRIMLNGEKIHADAYCEKNMLKAEQFLWETPFGNLKEFKPPTLEAGFGALLIAYSQGFFDQDLPETANNQSSDDKFSAEIQPNSDTLSSCSTNTIGFSSAPSIGGPFTLINQHGETVTEKDVITEPSLLYFGYTSCPDVCPLDNARNAEVVDILSDKGLSVTPVFISIDPKRDKPKDMAEFVKSLHPKMIGLTGSIEQVKTSSKAYRAYYKEYKTDDGEFYLIDHSTMTYLVLPEHGFVDFFTRDTSASQVANATACFISKFPNLARTTTDQLEKDNGLSDIIEMEDISPPLTSSEVAMFRNKIRNCWVHDGSQPVVTVSIELDQTGIVQIDTIELVNAYGGNKASQQDAFQRARRAIIRCSRGGFDFPPEKYEHWREIEIQFSP